jgi:carbon starvation protein
MLTEMCVGVMAVIAACAMAPGEYFAINVKGDVVAVTRQISALGFAVTPADMAALAHSIGEKTMVGRAGGAPTFALGMAQMLAGVLGSGAALAVWYHFAIMFEAMFILTTIDAGTRIGRFLVQDLFGLVWRPLGDTRSLAGNFGATTLFVGAWGWFLYQGVVDPLGGINSLWPIFGVANQLLAVIALSLGTTVLIKMGKARHAWATLLPLGWLLCVTMTAGWMKIFSADPRLGFLSAAGAALSPRQAVNARVDAAVTAAFLILVAVIVAANARVWWLLLAGGRAPDLREEPFAASRTLDQTS